MADIPLLVVPLSLTPSKLDLVLGRLCLEDATVCQTVSATFRAQAVRAIYANHLNPSNRFILCLGEGIWSRCYLGDGYINIGFSSDSLVSPTYGLSRMLFSQHPPPITIAKQSLDTFIRSLGDLQLELAHHRVNAHATSSLKIASIEFYVSDPYAACATSLATLNCATLLRDVFSSAHRTLRFLSVCCYGQSSTPVCKYMRLQLETINEALSNRRENFPVLREIVMPSEFMSGVMSNRTARRLAKTLEVLDMTLCPNLTGLLARVPVTASNAVAKLTEYVVYERVHTLRIPDGYYKSNLNGIDLYGHHHHQTPIKVATYQSLPNLRHVAVQRCMRNNAVLQQTPPPSARSQLQIIWGSNYETFYMRRRAGVDLVVPTIRKCDFLCWDNGGVLDVNGGADARIVILNVPHEVTALCKHVTIDIMIGTSRLLVSLGAAPRTLTTTNRIAFTKHFAPLHDLHCRSFSLLPDAEVTEVIIKPKRPRFTVRLEVDSRIHQPYTEVTEWLNMFHLQCICKQEPYLQQLLQREQAAAALAAATAAEVAPIVQHQEATVSEPPHPPAVAGGRKTLNSTGRRRRDEQDESETKSKKLAESATNLVFNPYALPPDYSSGVQPCELQISQLHIKTAAVTIQNCTTFSNYRKQILAAILTALADLPSTACVELPSSNRARTDSCTFGGHCSRTRGMSTKRLKVEKIDLNAASMRGADLADPLLHVRHIRLQCCVIIASSSFCSMPAIAPPEETSYYCSETDSMQDCVSESRFRTEDETCDKTTLPYLLFELISPKFRREHVAPLVRMIARRFVRLRHFTIMCDNVHSSCKVTYNLDDIVLEERIAAR